MAHTVAMARAALSTLVLLGTLAACARTDDSRSREGAGEEELIPNDGIVDIDHDGRPLRLVAEYYAARGYDLRSDEARLDLDWPLAGPSAKALNRFGTPQLLSNRGYFHTALDVIRHDEAASDDVLAPIAGELMIFDTYGAPRLSPQPYGSLVAIFDPASHLVVTLLHVAPAPAFAGIAAPVAVAKGTIIGTLASPPIDASKAVHFHHTHVNVIDGGAMRLLDPTPRIRRYRDTAPPAVAGVYVVDEAGERKDALVTGRLDLVVDAFDRDDESDRNLEVAALAVTVTDGAGNVLRDVPRCTVSHLFDSLALPYSERAKSLIDFASARAQVDDAWPKADIGNPMRRFRYALTHLAIEGGRCTTKDDADGFLDVPDAVSRLDVHVSLWDPSNNLHEETRTLARDPAATDPPRRLVTFEVEGATTSMGENVFVIGGARQLGAWDPRHAAKLAPVAYPTWRGSAWLDVGQTVDLKFVKITPPRDDAGWGAFGAGPAPSPAVVWESGPNRSYVVPAEPAPAIVRGTFRP